MNITGWSPGVGSPLFFPACVWWGGLYLYISHPSEIQLCIDYQFFLEEIRYTVQLQSLLILTVIDYCF